MKRDTSSTLVLILPWILTFAIFWLYPLLYALYLSFSKYYTLLNEAQFIGFENYIEIFSDELFWKALLNTTIFTLGTVPVTVTVSLLLAVFVNAKFVKFKNFFKSVFFMPSVTSLVVISLIFTNLYAKDGYVNAILGLLGLPYPEMGWLQDPSTALISIMAMDVWMSIGYYMVIFLASLQTIPNEMYENARLSGATGFQILKYVTLPMLKPTLLFVILINTIKSFQIFVEVYVMTKGGPMGATTTLVYLVYVNAFEKSDLMGYASAIAFVIFFILLIFSIVQIRLFESKGRIK